MEELPTNPENFVKIAQWTDPAGRLYSEIPLKLFSFGGSRPHPCTESIFDFSTPNFTPSVQRDARDENVKIAP